jgi:Mrp family chromosome partitioning ATPase/capsular polysaccharide biosynthesis protein
MDNFGSELSKPNWLAPQGPREGLSHYVEVLRGRMWLIIGCVVATTFVAAAYTTVAPREWKATSHLLISPVNGQNNFIGLGLITASSNAGGDISTAASFVTTLEVAALVAARLGDTSAAGALSGVSAVPVAQSNIVAITATSSSAARAQAIANAFAFATVGARTNTLHRALEAIIPTLRAAVRALPPAQQTGQGSLGERLALLETLRASPDPTISVASAAQRPAAPSWPRKKLLLIAGVLVGLVLGLSGSFALEALDPRVRDEEALRRIFRLPVLARIPRERRSARNIPVRPAELSPVAQESYRMLRVALGIRGRSGPARSLMVTGSTASEGKSSVALNLAATIAFAGQQVILVEADLRRPSVARALDLAARPGKRGTAGVLMGEIALKDALLPVPQLTDNLRVLLVEQSAPYLADGLLAASDDLLDQAEALADCVIFDAPPVTEVSDALPLGEHVDDVLITVRLGHSRTDQLVKLGEVLSRLNVRPSGLVVVTDEVKQGSGYYYAASTGSPTLLGRLREQMPAPGV